jgi:protein-L-isoaspartate O-methyltransferase
MATENMRRTVRRRITRDRGEYPTGWQELLDEVPRDLFIPGIVWVDIETGCCRCGLIALSQQDDPQRWAELLRGNEPVITQVDEGRTAAGDTGWSPSSSCSKPSIVAEMLAALDVQPGHAVLEIGTGTGWNDALLCRRVGPRGRVVTVEVDPMIAQDARGKP